jgi:hypothetical protein
MWKVVGVWFMSVQERRWWSGFVQALSCAQFVLLGIHENVMGSTQV